MADTLYKFLSADLALRVLVEKQLKLSLISELNDIYDCSPTIKAPADEPVHTDETWTKHVVAQNTKNYGMLCLTNSFQSPLLWGHYSSSGTGIALGFDPDQFPWKNPRPILYRDSRPRFDWPSEDQISAESVKTMLNESFCIKATEWAYEREVRYVLTLDTCQHRSNMYFAPFPDKCLKEIVLGYKCTVTTKQLQDILANDYKNCAVRIRAASPHPTSFKVEAADVL